jgi:hypothetical protein
MPDNPAAWVLANWVLAKGAREVAVRIAIVEVVLTLRGRDEVTP